MKTKLTLRFICALTIFSLVGQIAWVVENMYLNVFIYKMFGADAGDISAMVAASAVTATLTTVLIGALSDKMGKRKLFICGGYILWGISILCFTLVRTDIINKLFPMALSAAAVGTSLVIVLDCVMTFFGSSANDAAFNAWLTDSTDNTNRGTAEGINAMMPLVAILAVFGGFMSFDLDKARDWTLIFIIIGVCVIAVGIVGCFIIKDTAPPTSNAGYFESVIYGFRPSTVKENKPLYSYLLLFILFNISIQIFMPYLIIYYEVSLGMKDYVLVMAPAIVIASVVTAFWGKVYDKNGFGRSSAFSLAWLCLGYIVLFAATAILPVFIGSLLMMCGYLSGMAVFGAKIRDLTPREASGKLQGVRIFSQVLIPGVVGPFIGKAVLANAETIVNNDGTTSFVPNANIFIAALAVIIIVAIALLLIVKNQKPRTVDLSTPFEDDGCDSWNVYPRPGLKRDSFISLCGKWELSAKGKRGEYSLGEITVPFPPESRLSDIEEKIRRGDILIYKKQFFLPEEFFNDRVMINFGAVDQICQLYVNGTAVGVNIGGYLPFSFDITKQVHAGENNITLEVIDSLDKNIPYGKQKYDRGGMWYTTISGIWQPVWLESVVENYISAVRFTPDLDGVKTEVLGGLSEKTVILEDREYAFEGSEFYIRLDDPKHWTPETPYLYNVTIKSGSDKIESYFALRTVGIEKVGDTSYIFLNGKPYFFHGLLDQGYYPDGIYIPASPKGYEFDILEMKKLGFNMLRKHIKVEPELFYYFCDRYGMIVFQDMVNSGNYSFFIDTVLPTIGVKRGISHRATAYRREVFERIAKDTIDHLYNHPAVIYYTIFNEGWGQYDADKVYKELKALDSTRIWDATSGWFNEQDSDVVSEHIYFKKLDLKPVPSKPLVLSEFGGYSYKLEGHSFNLDKTYGYKFFSEREAFIDALESLYIDEVIPMINRGLCACVYTQVSDVEDETNGLYTYDRRVLKVDTERMLEISKKLHTAFTSKIDQQ